MSSQGPSDPPGSPPPPGGTPPPPPGATPPPPPGGTPPPPSGGTPPPPPSGFGAPPPPPPAAPGFGAPPAQGGYGAPGYGPPGAGGYAPAPAASQTNGLAIGALVCGILSFFSCGVLGLVGIVLGVLGLGKAKQLNGSGKGMAIGGIVTGALGILVGVGLFFLVILAGNSASNELDDAFCRSEVRTLESSISSFESVEGRSPGSVEELRREGYLFSSIDDYEVSNGEVVLASGSDCPEP